MYICLFDYERNGHQLLARARNGARTKKNDRKRKKSIIKLK